MLVLPVPRATVVWLVILVRTGGLALFAVLPVLLVPRVTRETLVLPVLSA
jgi:hypothetical protein